MSFQFLYNGNRIYDAKTLISDLNTDGSVTLEVLNSYEEDRVAYFYVQPASTGGDVDFPSKFPNQTSYQLLMNWGALADPKGLKVTVDGLQKQIRYGVGDTKLNAISLGVIQSNNKKNITITFVSNGDFEAERLFIGLVVE